MQIITTLSVGSTQGDFFLQDLHDNYGTDFFREKELQNPRILANKLIQSDAICITLTEEDNICDVIDYCIMLLKVLPNTKVKEILLNDTLIYNKAEKMEVYVTELLDLLELSNLSIQRTSSFKERSSSLLSELMVKNLNFYLKQTLTLRSISKKSFERMESLESKNKSFYKRKIRNN